MLLQITFLCVSMKCIHYCISREMDMLRIWSGFAKTLIWKEMANIFDLKSSLVTIWLSAKICELCRFEYCSFLCWGNAAVFVIVCSIINAHLASSCNNIQNQPAQTSRRTRFARNDERDIHIIPRLVEDVNLRKSKTVTASRSKIANMCNNRIILPHVLEHHFVSWAANKSRQGNGIR